MNRKQREFKRKKAQHHTKTQGASFVKPTKDFIHIQLIHSDYERDRPKRNFWLIRLFIWAMNFFKTPGKGI